jgi:hypothetical protein
LYHVSESVTIITHPQIGASLCTVSFGSNGFEYYTEGNIKEKEFDTEINDMDH